MLDREKVIQAMEWCQENACEGCPYDTHNNESCGISDDILTLLKEQKAVVRCKDCKHGEPSIVAWSNNYFCNEHKKVHEPDWFCADGKRRD